MPDSPLIRARFFDGRSSQPIACLLSLLPARGKRGVALRLHALPGQPGASDPHATRGLALREFSASQIEWPDAGDTRVAVIRFSDGSQAQTDDPQGLASALRAAGYRRQGLHALAHVMAGSWRALLAGAAVCTVLTLGLWLYGVPLGARAITHFIPERWDTELAARALQTLDQAWLRPSKLSAERRAQIGSEFDALVKKAWPDGSAPRYRLEFRSTRLGRGGANALALPGGTLVMTDELVALAEPAALMGVLAHELGHVKGRHATRMAVEGSLLGATVAVITGDITSVLATAPVLLATLSFSRSHETEADCFALQTLARAGQSAEPLARLLETIAGKHKAGAASVLSSHPSTPARVQLIRDAAAAKRQCG